MAEKRVKRIIYAHCNKCLQHTRHNVLAEELRESHDEASDGTPIFEERTVYQFIECCGCANISLRREYTSEPHDPDEINPRIDYFPPAVVRKPPSWVSDFSFIWGGVRGQIRELLGEVYPAIYSGSYRIALMGIRAVVDIVLVDKLGDVGGFKLKLVEAVNKGWITDGDSKVLDAAIEAGDAASHRGYRPAKDVLLHVLDIVEHLITRLYVHESLIKKIKSETPPRTKVTPSSP